MRSKVATIFLIAVSLFAVSVPLFPHYGNAAYATGTKVSRIKSA
jgi:hypothetical protein